MTDIPDNLAAMIENYAVVSATMIVDPKVIEARLAVESAKNRLVILEESLAEAEKPHRDELNSLEDYITGQILELGRSLSYKGVDVKHRSAYERVTWDNKQMTNLCMKNPALLDLLAPARKVTQVSASVKITYSSPDDL